MRNQNVNLLYKKITPLVFCKISVFIVQSSLLCWRNGVCHIEEAKNYKAFAGPFSFLHRYEPLISFPFLFFFFHVLFFLLYFFLVANMVKMSCSNTRMAYFHWARSTRANSCSEEKDMLLRLLKGQGLRPIAAVRQHVEITKFCSPMLTQDTGISSTGRRRLWGFESAAKLLQVLQFQGMVKGHKVRVARDPPKWHSMLWTAQTICKNNPKHSGI